jgi:hypothetical protein
MSEDLLSDLWAQSQGDRESQNTLREATPYRLDDDATQLLVEYILSMKGSVSSIHRTRLLARIPQRTVWVEWNNMKFTEVQERISGRETPDRHEIPFRRGYLYRQHPNAENGSIWRVMPVVELRQTGKPLTLPFTLLLRTDGEIMPEHVKKVDLEPRHRWIKDLEDDWNKVLGGDVLWSCEKVPVSVSKCARLSIGKILFKQIMVMQQNEGIQEAQSTLTNILEGMTNSVQGFAKTSASILCLLNEVPIRRVIYQPAGHFRANGSMKPFLKNSVVSIQLEKGRQSALKLFQLKLKEAAWRCRAHMVKGYWRCDLVHTFDNPPGENWVWQYSRRNRRECWQIWIKPHQRGDATLGWVNQVYEVSR